MCACFFLFLYVVLYSLACVGIPGSQMTTADCSSSHVHPLKASLTNEYPHGTRPQIPEHILQHWRTYSDLRCQTWQRIEPQTPEHVLRHWWAMQRPEIGRKELQNNLGGSRRSMEAIACLLGVSGRLNMTWSLETGRRFLSRSLTIWSLTLETILQPFL